MLSDLRATLDPAGVDGRVRDVVQSVIKKGASLERRYFPERSADIPNSPALTLVVMSPDQSWANGETEKTKALVRTLITDAGSSSRTYKSALFFAIPETPTRLREAAKTLLAWETLDGEATQRQLDDDERLQITKALREAERNLTEAVWQTYTRLLFLGPDGGLEELHLGQLHSSSAESLTGYIEQRLRQQDLLVSSINPGFLTRHWPSALPRWPLRSLRDAFYSSPLFPRLADLGALRSTVARGVAEGAFGYAQLGDDGSVSSLRFDEPVDEVDIEFSDATALVTKAEAAAIKTAPDVPLYPATTSAASGRHGSADAGLDAAGTVTQPTMAEGLRWSGELPTTKWALFYSKVLARLVAAGGLRMHVDIEASPVTGLPRTQVDEVKQGLIDLELGPPAIYTGTVVDLEGDIAAEALVHVGETATVEFKETARFNTKSNSVDRGVELAVVKTVAGFFNASGGILLLGVSDVGEVVGLDRDIATLHERKTTDGYEQFLRNLLIKTVGKEECSRIAVTFPEVGGTAVCAIRVPPAHKPVYVTDGPIKTFYVRFGNTTQPFDVEDAHTYMLRRFYH